jgi:hypothetical protein
MTQSVAAEVKRLKKPSAKEMQKVVKKDVEGGDVRQICIPAYNIDQLLKIVPSSIKIENLRWEYSKYPKVTKLAISKKVQRLGVISARTSDPKLRVYGVFRDTTPRRASILLNEISKEFGFPPAQVLVRTVTLSRDGAKAYFEHSTKEIRENVDLRKKTKVLGLIAVSRDPVKVKMAHKMISELHPKEYQCKFVVVEKKAVICSSME